MFAFRQTSVVGFSRISRSSFYLWKITWHHFFIPHASFHHCGGFCCKNLKYLRLTPTSEPGHICWPSTRDTKHVSAQIPGTCFRQQKHLRVLVLMLLCKGSGADRPRALLECSARVQASASAHWRGPRPRCQIPRMFVIPQMQRTNPTLNTLYSYCMKLWRAICLSKECEYIYIYIYIFQRAMSLNSTSQYILTLVLGIYFRVEVFIFWLTYLFSDGRCFWFVLLCQKTFEMTYVRKPDFFRKTYCRGEVLRD